MTLIAGKRSTEPVLCAICGRAHSNFGYGKPQRGAVLWLCSDCTAVAKKGIIPMSEREFEHFEKTAISTASQKIVQNVVVEILDALHLDGINVITDMTEAKFDMLCERIAVEGRMIVHGRAFLLAYAAEMKDQISRNDAPF